MNDLRAQIAYWNGPGGTKTFTHPIEPGWLAGLPRHARVLDYGCGYGRVLAELSRMGFTNLEGVDISQSLIERGRAARPDLRLSVLGSPPHLPHPAASFDLVLVVAVLTCVPADAAQVALIAELARVLTPGGLLYVSDLLLRYDARNRERYAAHTEASTLPYGVFTTGDGAVCRHHDVGRLRGLLSGFDPVCERRLDVTTMNGHRSRAIQLLVRAPQLLSAWRPCPRWAYCRGDVRCRGGLRRWYSWSFRQGRRSRSRLPRQAPSSFEFYRTPRTPPQTPHTPWARCRSAVTAAGVAPPAHTASLTTLQLNDPEPQPGTHGNG